MVSKPVNMNHRGKLKIFYINNYNSLTGSKNPENNFINQMAAIFQLHIVCESFPAELPL